MMISSLQPVSGRTFDVSDPFSRFYLYQAGNRGFGLVCRLSLPNACVLGHEEIYEHQAETLLEDFHISQMQCNPILLITTNAGFKDQVTDLAKTAQIVSHTDVEPESHSIWKTERVDPIQLAGPLYIADGHHRFFAATKYHQQSSTGERSPGLMAAVFCADQVAARHKALIVKNLKMSHEEFKHRLQGYFEISTLAQPKNPTQKHTFTMRIGQAWYSIQLKSHFLGCLEKNLLSIEILREYVLRNILDIDGYASNEAVRVLFETCNIEALKRSLSHHMVGFIAASDSSQEIIEIARQGRLVEANSTYFEPKLVTGMIRLHL